MAEAPPVLRPVAHPALYRPFGAFRFGLALLVVIQHGLLVLPRADREIFYDAELGVLAVATFFVISGLIVAEANASFYPARPVAFLTNRVLRLVPPYLAALALAIAVEGALYALGRPAALDQSLGSSPLRPLPLLSGLLEIVPGFEPRYLLHREFSFIPFAWTLRVEFAFYIAAFATYATMAAGPRLLPRRIARALPFGAVSAAYLLFVLYLLRHGAGPQQLADIPFFLFGIAAFLLWRRRDRAAALHLALAGALLCAAFPYWHQRGHPVLEFQLPALIGLCGLFLILAFAKPVRSGWKRWDKRLGDLSYPLYVNHGTVLVVLAGMPDRFGPALYATAILLSCALAAVMHRIVEAPMKSLRDRVRGTAL